MLYFITGEAEQHLNGKSFIAHDGDLVLIRSSDIHATYCEPQEDCRILVLKFLPSIVDPGFLKLETSRYLYAFLNYSSVSDIRNLDCDRLDELKSVLLDIFKEYTNKERAFEIRIRGFIYEFVALLVRYDLISLPDPSVSAKDLDRIGAVIVNMNYSYVSRYFKKVTGRNFKEYLDYIRVCEAEKLIMQRGRFMYEIAEQCGFASIQSFNRTYRRIRDCAPGRGAAGGDGGK